MNDLVPILAPDQAAARQLAVADYASSTLDHASRLGRYPGPADGDPALEVLAARGRTALAVSANTAQDRAAGLLAQLREIDIDPAQIDRIVAEFERFAAELTIRNEGDLYRAGQQLRAARIARLAYEKEFPAARLWRLRTSRVKKWVRVAGVGEAVGGGYVLSQAARVPGGWFGGGLVMGVLFGVNFKLGQIAGRAAADRAVSPAFRYLKAISLVAAALGLDLVLGCLRADLPFTVEALKQLIIDPVKYYPAWLVVTMEVSVLFGTSAYAFGRRAAGDTAHYAMLCQAEEEAERALQAIRSAIGRAFTPAVGQSMNELEAAVARAKASSDAAAQLYAAIRAERRAVRRARDDIVSQAASVARDAHAIAVSQWHGPRGGRAPDFDKAAASLIPMPDSVCAEVGVAHHVFRSIRGQMRETLQKAKAAPGRMSSIRLAIMKSMYTT
jgi:hypothetical protein